MIEKKTGKLADTYENKYIFYIIKIYIYQRKKERKEKNRKKGKRKEKAKEKERKKKRKKGKRKEMGWRNFSL